VRFTLRDFRPADADAVNRVALAAFAEFRDEYADWPTHADRLARAAELAAVGETIVACGERDGGPELVVGVVTYLGPHPPGVPRSTPEWAAIRLLAVDPAFRGRGLGRALTEECLRRARRDGASVVALHTSPIMRVALPMYLRMGFELVYQVPEGRGEGYGVYAKRLTSESTPSP
jgi:ribosomal protein S18 acetylase RimI-like enzyme